MLQALKSVPQNEGHSRSSAQRAAGPADWPRPMAALQGGRPFGKQQPWLWALLAFASKASSPPHCLRDGGRGEVPRSLAHAARWVAGPSERRGVTGTVWCDGDRARAAPGCSWRPGRTARIVWVTRSLGNGP